MTDAHLRILGVIARGRARRLAAHDRSAAGAPPSPTPRRTSLARQSDRAQGELDRARRRRDEAGPADDRA